MKRKIFTLCTALILGASTVFASNTAVNGIYYDFHSYNRTASVTYAGNSYNVSTNEYTGNVVIPATVPHGGQTYSVTSIGSSAFYNCTGLTSITIPNSVTCIERSAFSGCSGLTSITIPNSVTSIGDYAFSGCSGLTSIIVENGNPKYDSRDNCNAIIETATNTLIAGCQSTTIPNSVTRIERSAFSGCSGLTSVTIPNSVTSIFAGAFSDCSGLTSIIVESGNPTNDSRDNCNAIIETATNTLIAGCQSTIIPKSVTSIGERAFYGCSGLTSVTIPNSVTSIGGSAFEGCSGLTSVTIPNSVTSIGAGAFSGCSGLTSVTIPNSVTSIGDGAFRRCSGLTSVTIPDSVESIGAGAFSGCSSLTSVVWNVKNCADFEYSNYAPFYDSASQITSFTFGDEVEHIPAFLCYGCRGLTSVTIPNSVTSIGDYAFEYCSGLTKTYYTGNIAGWCGITFGNIYSNPLYYSTLYYSNIFINNEEVKDLVIPNSVTSIGDYAFYGCSGLTSVTIPNSVTSIGRSAFSGCSGLTKITCYADNPPSISDGSFTESTYDNVYLAVPYNSWQAYKYHSAYIWRNFRHIGWICDTLDVNYAEATYDEERSKAGAENFSIEFMYYNAEEDSVYAPYVIFNIYSASATAISGWYSVADATINDYLYLYVVLTDAKLVAEADGVYITTDATLTLAYVEQEKTKDGDIVYLYDVAAKFTANGKKYAIKAQVPLRAYKGLDTNEDGYYDSWVAYELIEDATAIRTVEIDNTVYARDGRIVCEGEFRIYDLLGRDVTRLNGSLCGVYVVKSGNAAVKVVVK